ALRDNRRAQLPADADVGVGDGLLGLRRVLACPGHVENRPRARGLDRLVEEPDVVVHALRVLDRQRALLLENDVVVMAALNRLQRLAGVPVRAQRRAAGADQAVLEGLTMRFRQPRDQAGKVVAGGETVADEEHLQRGVFSSFRGHVNLPVRLSRRTAWLLPSPGRRTRTSPPCRPPGRWGGQTPGGA